MKKLFSISLSLLLLSCASADFTKTGTYQAKPRPLGCEYIIYTTPPKSAYEEIGLIELSKGAEGFPSSISGVKELVSDYVCSNGGNALFLWEANGRGQYIKATVAYTK